MRPLTEEETKIFFEKLAKYIGKNILYLIDSSAGTAENDNEEQTDPQQHGYCFRLQKDKVYYVREDVMKKATNISRDQLCSLGTCMGKFTKSRKFRLQITALDVLAQYAKHKCWLRSTAEMPFLYGNNVVKAHLARISDDVPEHGGVVIFNSGDVALGFGVMARAGADLKSIEPTAVAIFHQADCGEYLRDEQEMF